MLFLLFEALPRPGSRMSLHFLRFFAFTLTDFCLGFALFLWSAALRPADSLISLILQIAAEFFSFAAASNLLRHLTFLSLDFCSLALFRYLVIRLENSTSCNTSLTYNSQGLINSLFQSFIMASTSPSLKALLYAGPDYNRNFLYCSYLLSSSGFSPLW